MKNTLAIFIGAVIAPAIGQWVDLPTQPENIKAIIEEVKAESGCEEIMISDTDGISAGEWENPYTVNERAQELSEMTEDERMIYEALCDYYSEEEAREILESGDYAVYYDCYNMTDVAMQYAEETGLLDSIPENLRGYFDYEAFGRDMEIDGTFIYAGNGIYIEAY